MSNRVPHGWIVSQINDTCDVFDYMRIPLNTQERALRKGRYPYYGANGVQGYIDDYIFDGEYVLLAEDGGYFDQWSTRPISYLVTGKFWVNNHAHILKAKAGHETKYVHYSLVHKNILEHINGGTRSKLNQSDMRNIEYLTPPLPEQQKIAIILSSVDDVIEKTRAQIDKLKDLKTGMMQELLTKGIGHTEFKDSPVGRIPAGWEVKALGDVFALSSGSTPSRSVPEYYCSSLNAHSWVKTLDLSDGLIFKTDEKITDQAIQNSSCKVYPIGTALVAMYGGWNQIGRSGLLAIPAATNQAICALLSKGIVEGSYANYWLASERYRWKSIAASSRKDPNITKQDVSDFLITVPTLDEQKKIVIRLDNATELVDKKIKQLSFYTSIKKALMQDLLTGKVRVNLTDKESAVV